ncbi:MAG TPA: DNA mismatch repair endonuclease MutL [Verrucomicrobiae bacterium]|nr:DNA mismatch repair endonuclease MutL [Verrucomicrobiae bacterium]
MNRIKLLPEHVANQIAAGEVVERPASVVKELVENALDAGAKKISVEIQAGGRSLIRVTDDGIGMNRDDALLCLERHATSKIQRAEDLSSIATMGFRGEALPSIASVSKFTLTTRERDGDSPEATQIIIAGGKISEVKAAGSATGTSIEVRQLFFNLPARRKFLRTEETEAAHTLHYLTLAALAYPEVAFTFVKDGRPVWQLPAQKSGSDENGQFTALRERIRALTGDVKLVPVDFSAPFAMPDDDSNEVFETAIHISEAKSEIGNRKSSIRVWGFIGSPGVSRATREDQHLFVNRRPVENRGLNFALLEGYHTALMKGRYPVCCLFVEIDPAAVDVNIHPAKREVKFHREADVRRFVAQAVREALLEFHAAGHKKEPAPAQSLLPTRPIEKPVSRIGSAPTSELPAFASQPIKHAPLPPQPVEQQSLRMGFSPVATTPVPPQPPITTSAPSSFSTQPSVVPLLSVPLRLVGVVGKLYVVLESDRGLVLLDQHAAHERILFEQMLERLERNTQAPSQKLLLPETIELSPRDAQFMREQLPSLGRLGVGLSEFGERTFLLDALPPFVKVSDARRFVLDLVDELKSAGKDINSARLGEHVVAKTVCRHAVKANDLLTGRELENLVEDLRRCAMPYTCPHGRPTLIEMNYRELEKKFGRAH